MDITMTGVRDAAAARRRLHRPARGLIYAPYGPVTITLLQRKAPFDELASLSALRSAILVIATPLGAALGGLLVGALGAAETIRLSGLSTVGLAGLGAVSLLLVHAVRTRRPGLRARRGDSAGDVRRPPRGLTAGRLALLCRLRGRGPSTSGSFRTG